MVSGMSKTTKETGYIVISNVNPALVLCTDGEFHARGFFGPGHDLSAKIYKTEAGAKKHNPGRIVQPATL